MNEPSAGQPAPPTPEGIDPQLLEAIAAFVNAEDWTASREILGRNPLLLSEEADRAFERLIRAYLVQNNLRLAYHLALHRDLLRACREVGYAEAFRLISTPPSAEMVRTIAQFINAEDWQAARHVVEAHPELLSREAEAAFQALIQAAIVKEDDQWLETLATHQTLLRACRQLGVEEAFRRAESAPDEATVEQMILLSVVSHNTLAVLLHEPNKRDEWAAQVRHLQRRARAEGDKQGARLFGAILRLLGGRSVETLRPRLSGVHADVWRAIAAALRAQQRT